MELYHRAGGRWPINHFGGASRKSIRRKKTRQLLDGFFSTTNNKPDDNLLSHWLQHYHRRKVVS
ncbi:hypothetical protein, partial [Janthinobacterium sp. HLX7-2]|uniref:hypothetical protein n=1 Tax=Janthinobacterium sp. HLX7-2 TaxID=1259331 RepID=UPI003F1FE731